MHKSVGGVKALPGNWTDCDRMAIFLLMNISISAAADALAPYLGLAAVAVIFLAGIIVVRYIGRKKQISPYSRQLISAALGTPGIVTAVLVLPVGAEIRAQILTLFGILISAVIALSSTNLMGNAMAGIMLRLSHSFRPGDFIEVEEKQGRVVQQGLFATEVQIITRDIVTLPNLYLIRQSIRVVNPEGSFISAPVSIGYDEQHEKVEEALLEAAGEQGLGDSFVYIEQLLDHAVVYRLYGYLEEYTRILTAKSDLKKAVLDSLHRNGIEVASPSLVIRRDISSKETIRPEEGAPRRSEGRSRDERIEEKSFDKAEDAADLEKMKEQYKQINREIDELKSSDGGEGAEAKDGDRIRELRRKAELLEKRIEERQKDREE